MTIPQKSQGPLPPRNVPEASMRANFPRSELSRAIASMFVTPPLTTRPRRVRVQGLFSMRCVWSLSAGPLRVAGPFRMHDFVLSVPALAAETSEA